MTRKLSALTLGLALVTGFIPTVALAAPLQTVSATIAAPIRPAQDPSNTWPGGHRQVYQNAGEPSNGITGYTFPVTKGTVDGKFKLEVTGASVPADLDITFYASFSPVVSSGASTERKIGGEEGVVPVGSTLAIVTMFEGANASFIYTAFAAPPEPPLPPSTPGIYPNLGKGASAAAEKLRNKAHVVIAVIDTGINPYHMAYRRPEYTVHPSEYIDGFPKDAPALSLTFGQKYVASRRADDAKVWSKVKQRKLYWIPGTNIVGGYSVFDEPGAPPAGLKQRPIIDDQGHGTGTTSVATGAALSKKYKAPVGSNPDALVVIIEGLGHDAVKWASEQPWIDFVSGSYGDGLAVPWTDTSPDLPKNETVGEPVYQGREYRYTAPFVLRDGRTACFSSGNGFPRGLPVATPTVRYSSIRPTSGPSWVVSVGAVSPRNEQAYNWHNGPVDISSYGQYWPSAAPFSVADETNFSGTSNATPVTCGVFSRVLLEARRALGDTSEGIDVDPEGNAVPAIGPANFAPGMLADGIFSREELESVVLKTAQPGGAPPTATADDLASIPDTPLYYTQEGYGVANVASAKRAIDVVLGRAELPARAEVDTWISLVDSARNALWPPPTYEKRAGKPLPQRMVASGTKKPPSVKGARHTLPATGVADGMLMGTALLAASMILRRRIRWMRA